MRPWQVLVGLSAFFILFFTGLGLWLASEENTNQNLIRAESSSKKSKSDRQFEKSEITSQTKSVEDEPSALFNDPAITQAWGLKKSDAGRAWSVTQGSQEIKVCVIDTGVDIKHEDLSGNLWKNPGETGLDEKGRDKASNKKDDDGDGYVDNLYGWNFVSNNNDLTDNHGHGTHISGIIGAEAGNNKGISGIAPKVSIITAKYYDPKVANTDNLKNTINSIYYCIKQGAHIINYSGGGTEYSQEEHDAVEAAQRAGILFVAAAGNERSNSDQFHYYPADYKLKNIISVTAIDPSTQVLSSSNYGIETVDLAAPGQNILSTLPGNSYGFMTGTSQATAFVTGAAVLAMAHKKTTNLEEIKKYILATGDATTSLASKTRTSRMLNLYKVLTIMDDGVTSSGLVSKEKEIFTIHGLAQSGSSAKLKNDGSTATSGLGHRFGQNLMDVLKEKSKANNKKDKPRLGNTKSNEL